MAVSRQRKNLGYGVGQPLFDYSPRPIVTKGAPTTKDSAEIGTVWINKTTNRSYVLTSIVANSATWTPTSVNAGSSIAGWRPDCRHRCSCCISAPPWNAGRCSMRANCCRGFARQR